MEELTEYIVKPGGVEIEARWICEYPEFNDNACMVQHEPERAAMPRKHTDCGWYLCIPAERRH